jgi:hypothetical protein
MNLNWLQLREEEKQIGPDELIKSLGINQNKLNQLVNVGLLPRTVKKGNSFPSELFSCLKKWKSLPLSDLSDESNEYFHDLITAKLLQYNGGIFVVSLDSHPQNFHGMSEMIERYGIWKAQGLNNHIHLNEITDNIVHQIVLAGYIIESWIKEIFEMQLSGGYVIYWNGTINSTICIYSLCNVKNGFLEKYDAELGIETISIKILTRVGGATFFL